MGQGQQPSSQVFPGQCNTSCAEIEGPRVSPRPCVHVDSTRPMQSQIWPFGEGLNPEKMVPFYTPHVCRLHTGKTMAPVLPVPTPKALSSVLPCTSLGFLSCDPLHQRPGEFPSVSKSMCQLYKTVSGFPAAFCPTGKGRQSPC